MGARDPFPAQTAASRGGEPGRLNGDPFKGISIGLVGEEEGIGAIVILGAGLQELVG